MRKQLEKMIIVLLISLSSMSTIAQNLSVPVCSFLPFKGISWCNAGELTLYWWYCGKDENGNLHNWTLVDAYFNMGDGNVVYYDFHGGEPLTHQYTIMGQVEISGYANFVDDFGNTTTSPVVWMDDAAIEQNPCSLYFDSTATFSNYFTLDIHNINPLFPTSNNQGQISFFNH